jgi:hypothetical protein
MVRPNRWARSIGWRALIAAFGICAIGWALDVIPVFRASDPIIQTAQRILAGEKFSSAQLDTMKRDSAVASGKLLLASAASGAVTIRSRWLEDQLRQETSKAGSQGYAPADIDELRSRAAIALALAPTDSFMWLAAFWLSPHGQVAGKELDLLRMSYSTGGNEGWIAVRRSPLALGMLDELPDELRSQGLSEFVRLLHSGLYADAANILAGPAWAVREQLLKRLDEVDETDRTAFAKAVDAKDLPGVDIPLPEKRPDRPF